MAIAIERPMTVVLVNDKDKFYETRICIANTSNNRKPFNEKTKFKFFNTGNLFLNLIVHKVELFLMKGLIKTSQLSALCISQKGCAACTFSITENRDSEFCVFAVSW